MRSAGHQEDRQIDEQLRPNVNIMYQPQTSRFLTAQDHQVYSDVPYVKVCKSHLQILFKIRIT